MKKKQLRPAPDASGEPMEGAARAHRLPAVVPNPNGSPSAPKSSNAPVAARVLKPTSLKPMGTQQSLYGSTVGLSDEGRKRRIIRTVPLLTQAIRDFFVNEDALIQALQITLYANGEAIFYQGQTGRDLYFVEEGRVKIVQKRLGGMNTQEIRAVQQHAPTASLDTEVHVRTFKDGDYFGEVALLQSATRNSSAIADGKVSCMVLPEAAYRTLLEPVHPLLLNRYYLRFHAVLERVRIFKTLTPTQLQHLIDHCVLENFSDGAYLCRRGELEERFYVIVEGEAQVIFDKSEDAPKQEGHTIYDIIVAETTKALGQKKLFECFGEMGLLGKPRSATVVSVGSTMCLVITRKTYLEALQIGETVLDAEAEALLASSLVEEWNLTKNALNLHISNPRVAHYLVMFINKFKQSYNQKFTGKTSYMDLFRRIHEDVTLIAGLVFIVDRIDWESPTSSLSIIRAETQRILHMVPSRRTPDELSFLGRLIETGNILSKFDLPPKLHRFKVAQFLGRVVTFLTIKQDTYVFRQGKEESKAFVILRGKINIVNEEMSTMSASHGERSNSIVKRPEILTTLIAGESFGELSLITVMKRSASAIAAADADLLVIDRAGLHALMKALPGVSIRHVMAKRVEFLGNLDCFRNCDLAQRIRISHDMQEAVYEPRHVFFQDPGQQKDVIFVINGEISVFVKKSRAFLAKTDPPIGFKDHFLLVKVATIGPHEFFGTAILTDVFATSSTKPNSTVATDSQPMLNEDITSEDVTLAGETIYMCDSRVQVLSMADRGWKRLDANILHSMRATLVERNRWHHQSVVANHHDVACFQLDKPWILVSRGPASLLVNQGSTHLSRHSLRPTALAEQLTNLETSRTKYSHFFPPFPPKVDPQTRTNKTVNDSLPVVPVIPSSLAETRRNYCLGGSFFTAMEPVVGRELVSSVEKSSNATCWMNFSKVQRRRKPQTKHKRSQEDEFLTMWKAHPQKNFESK